ncbi:MAG: alpha/beta hydrolase fold domain-containing protein [Thermoguttaceae bacterium]
MKGKAIGAVGLVVVLSWANWAFSQEQAKSLPPPPVKVWRDLPYMEHGGPRNRLDLYLPENVSGPLPLVVWVHPGAWQQGSKELCPAVLLVAKGYAVASINFRLAQDAVFPAQIEDCKAAIRWLRANAVKYRLDAAHIGVWGASSGGHLVSLLGTTGGVKEFEGTGGHLEQSSRVQAVVDWFGPTDFNMPYKLDREAASVVALLIGPADARNQEKLRRASPVTYVGRDSAPFLIMHGADDAIVPVAQSELLAAALKKAGVEAKLVIIPGNGHGGIGFGTAENWTLIEDFFAKHLGKDLSPFAERKAALIFAPILRAVP